MKKIRVLLTGGGTGGHIFPLIAVAQELKRQSDGLGLFLDMRYFGSAYEYAREIVENDIEFVPAISSKLRRYWSPLNLIDAFKFLLSLSQLLWKIFWFMPDVIFSKGGPGALAVILIGRFYRIPVVIHESDSISGLTNKISGILAKKIFLAFSSAGKYFSSGGGSAFGGKNKDIEVVGNPVRESLFRQASSLSFNGEEMIIQAKKGFGLDINIPIILVLGGSQGAEPLNSFIMENLESLVENFQVIHQVGNRNYDEYKKEFEFVAKEWTDTEKDRYIFRPFFSSGGGSSSGGDILADALLAADIVVARAGAGTIFEIAAFGKPSILIPLPESANDHQNGNARFYNQTGAAIVIQQGNLLESLFLKELGDLINDKNLLKKMSDAAKSFYRPDAAKIIARHLLTYVS